MSDYQAESFHRVKGAMCKAFCVSDLNCKWCIMRKVTPGTAGKYRLKDLLDYPKKEMLRRYGR